MRIPLKPKLKGKCTSLVAACDLSMCKLVLASLVSNRSLSPFVLVDATLTSDKCWGTQYMPNIWPWLVTFDLMISWQHASSHYCKRSRDLLGKTEQIFWFLIYQFLFFGFFFFFFFFCLWTFMDCLWTFMDCGVAWCLSVCSLKLSHNGLR